MCGFLFGLLPSLPALILFYPEPLLFLQNVSQSSFLINARLCSRGRLKLVVTDIRGFQLAYIDDFATKDEVIDANLASAHIPFFLDGRPFASFR